MLKRNILLISTMMGLAIISTPIYAEEESGQCESEEVQGDDGCDEERCSRHRRRCRQQQWKEDYFEEEQYEEVGWPGRRDDEFSDWLSR